MGNVEESDKACTTTCIILYTKICCKYAKYWYRQQYTTVIINSLIPYYSCTRTGTLEKGAMKHEHFFFSQLLVQYDEEGVYYTLLLILLSYESLSALWVL